MPLARTTVNTHQHDAINNFGRVLRWGKRVFAEFIFQWRGPLAQSRRIVHLVLKHVSLYI